MNDDFDVENMLRASFAEHARRAPGGDALAERIIAQADQPRWMPAPPRQRRWHSWALPVVAAGSVVAVVGAIVATTQLRSRTAGPVAITPPLPGVSVPFSAAPAPSGLGPPAGPASASTASAPMPLSPTRSEEPSLARPAGPPVGPVPRAFRVADLTFVSPEDGWALGAGQCFADGARRCPALLRTNDGGSNWVSIPNPPPSAGHIRFANQAVGYAFGASALFMTTSGGADWIPQSGGAVSLEVANGTALRVDPDGTLQIAKIGTDIWRDIRLPSGGARATTLQRAAHNAFVRARPGGETVQHLYASADDGVSWADRANPCRKARADTNTDIGDIAVGADGSVTLVCTVAGAAGQDFLITSVDAGRTFGKALVNPQIMPNEAVAAADGTTLFYAADALYRSSDGGSQWHRVCADATTGNGSASFLGFQTTATGRWVSGDGSTVWTTQDGGRSWQPHTFG